jgi:hypothetical protein
MKHRALQILVTPSAGSNFRIADNPGAVRTLNTTPYQLLNPAYIATLLQAGKAPEEASSLGGE